MVPCSVNCYSETFWICSNSDSRWLLLLHSNGRQSSRVSYICQNNRQTLISHKGSWNNKRSKHKHMGLLHYPGESCVFMLCNIKHIVQKRKFEMGIQNGKNTSGTSKLSHLANLYQLSILLNPQKQIIIRKTLKLYIQSINAQMFRTDTNPVPDLWISAHSSTFFINSNLTAVCFCLRALLAIW